MILQLMAKKKIGYALCESTRAACFPWECSTVGRQPENLAWQKADNERINITRINGNIWAPPQNIVYYLLLQNN